MIFKNNDRIFHHVDDPSFIIYFFRLVVKTTFENSSIHFYNYSTIISDTANSIFADNYLTTSLVIFSG